MNLTRESEYALKGLAWLAKHPPGNVVPLVEIAEVQQLPSTFLAKIFQKLVRHGLLESDRGRGSGYTLRGAASDIRVRDILEAIEGPMALKQCLLWSGHPTGRGSPVWYGLGCICGASRRGPGAAGRRKAGRPAAEATPTGAGQEKKDDLSPSLRYKWDVKAVRDQIMVGIVINITIIY